MTASRLFSEDDRTCVAAAVAEAERGTAGEIVPVVATASGRYDRAECICGFTFALVVLAALWLIFQGVAPAGDNWEPAPALGLLEVLGVLGGAFVAGVVAAGRLPILRRVFVTRGEMREEVERAAAAAFHRFRARRTTAATGMVLYVSLYERMVRVVGDDAIASKLAPADWEAVRDRMLGRISAGEPTDALLAGIEAAGALLREHFPAGPGDENELFYELRFVD